MNTNASAASASIDPRLIWAIALPAMATNVATALIGVGDMWIVGGLGDAPTQGAVDIGAKLFAALFTVMNFLKMGTTGLVAQAGTRSGERAQAEVLVKGVIVALAIAALLLGAKPLLLPVMLDVLGAEGAVRSAAVTYADIRYWSAPAVLANFALVGFLVGRRRMREVLVIEVLYNVLNVVLGLWLALGLEWGIAGIGWSSFMAEFAKLAVSLYAAGYLVRQEEAVRHHWSGLAKLIAILSVVAALLLLEPDFGATVIIVGVVVGMTFLAGAKLVYVLAMLAAAGV